MQAHTIKSIKNKLGSLLLVSLLGLSFLSPASLQAKENYDSGIFDFQHKLAKNGNPQAQYKLANMYEKGRGVAKDLTKAKEWYNKSAAGKYAPAVHRLTYLEVRTRGFKAEHKSWLTKLTYDAKQGDGEAMFILGEMYESGTGVKRNLKNAQKYYKSSSVKGNVDAENRLYDVEQKIKRQKAEMRKKRETQKKEKEARAQAKAQEAKAKKRQAEKARKAKAAKAAKNNNQKQSQYKADQERKKLENERKKLAAERRKLEAQQRALKKKEMAAKEAAQDAEAEGSNEEKFESDLCTGRAARFRTQCN